MVGAGTEGVGMRGFGPPEGGRARGFPTRPVACVGSII